MSYNERPKNETYATLNLDFKPKLLFLSVPPLISPAQTELSVIQGFQALLPCAAQGSPEPRISWEKNGTPVPNLPGKYTVLRSGELIIERAEVRLLLRSVSPLGGAPVTFGSVLVPSHSLQMLECLLAWRPMLQDLPGKTAACPST